jgi:hypothetical protein
MAKKSSRPGESNPPQAPPVYGLALEAAEEVSEKSLEHLRDLQDRYPGGIPSEFTRRPASPEAGPERRWTPRFRSPLDQAVLSTLGRPRREVAGRVLNRSWGGLSLLTASPVEVGSVMRLRPVGQWPTAPALIEVRYCQSLRGRWVVGCAFVRLPGYAAPAGAAHRAAPARNGSTNRSLHWHPRPGRCKFG